MSVEQKLILNPEWEYAQFVSIAELRECEQKLEAANDRIKRLEDALNSLTLVVGLTPIAGNKDALQEAFDMARSELKAKEAA